MGLSEHFTLFELTRSDVGVRKGIDNTPSPEIQEALRTTALNMERVRSLLGHPIHVLSGYRSLKVNAAVGGSSTSQHCLGEAVDFVCPQFGDPLDICRAIIASDIEFDQLIYEGEWVHISFSPNERRSILTAHFANGRATYTQGIV